MNGVHIARPRRGRLDWWRWLVGFPKYYRALRAARRNSRVPRLVIVGNAPLAFDCSELIDRAEVVVRINECKGATTRCGTRTTVLCINNTGFPARRYIADTPFRNHPLCVGAREIWFPRHAGIHEAFVAGVAPDRPRGSYEDLTEEIIQANGLGDRVLLRFSQELNASVFDALQSTMRRHGTPEGSFECPSTGMLLIAHVLAAPAYRNHEIHLIGFRFRGWAGHPWQSERRLVEEYARSGKLHLHST